MQHRTRRRTAVAGGVPGVAWPGSTGPRDGMAWVRYYVPDTVLRPYPSAKAPTGALQGNRFDSSISKAEGHGP